MKFILPLLFAAQSVCAEEADKLNEFEKLREQVQQATSNSTEVDALRMIQLSEELARPYAAYITLKAFLSSHQRPSSKLLLKAAQVAYQAGDFRTAVARYKGYFQLVDPSPESAQAVAELLRILIDLLGAKEDAYQFLKGSGSAFREHIAARKFDIWFLLEAKNRGDIAGLFHRLGLIMSEKYPLPLEQYLCWEYLNWGFQSMRRIGPEHIEALPFARKVIPLIRNSQRRSVQYLFYVTEVEYRANLAGKDEKQKGELYQKVLRAAEAYFNAFPEAETLKDILFVINSDRGHHLRDDLLQEQQAFKQVFFVDAFLKFGTPEQLRFLDWGDGTGRLNHFATPAQWSSILIKSPELVKSMHTALERLSLDVRNPNLQNHIKLASAIGSTPNSHASIIRAIAHGQEDLTKAYRFLLEKETAHLSFTNHHTFRNPREILGQVWETYHRIYETNEKLKDRNFTNQAYFDATKEVLPKLPFVAFDRDFAEQFLMVAWEVTPGSEKKNLIPLIEAFAWVPWDESNRKHVYRRIHEQYRNWATDLDRRNRREDQTVSPEEIAQVGPVGEALKQGMEKEGNPALAPTPLTKATALAIRAEQTRDLQQFLASAREIYKLINAYPQQPVPYGKGLLEYILWNRLQTFDVSELQVEILEDQLKRYSAASRPHLYQLFNIVRGNRGWYDDWQNIQKAEQPIALGFNKIFGQAILDLAEKGMFDQRLFHMFRNTCRGNGWSAPTAGVEVMEKLIAGKTLFKHDYRHDSGGQSAAVTYMAILRNEFLGLNTKYPYGSYFDDLFVEEAQQRKFLDSGYWNFGRDEKKTVITASAEILKNLGRYPFGFEDGSDRWDPDNYWRWIQRALTTEETRGLAAELEKLYGKTLFDPYARGMYWFSGATLATPAERKEYFDMLAKYVERCGQLPERTSPPDLGRLGTLDPKSELSQNELAVLKSIFTNANPAHWPSWWNHDQMGMLLLQGLIKGERENEIPALLPDLWRISRGSRSMQFSLGKTAQHFLEKKQYDLAASISIQGLEIQGGSLSDEVRAQLLSARSEALRNIGGGIPVSKLDPRYSLYEAQTSFLAGNVQAAWETVQSELGKLPSMFEEIDPDFSIWVIRRLTEGFSLDKADTLAREMMQWMEKSKLNFEPEIGAGLNLAYADIAFARREMPRARALYERIAANAEFKGTSAQMFANLRVADADRITKQYELAIERLEKLALTKDVLLQTEANFGLALVKFDQEDYNESADFLQKVFAKNPEHSNARILEGRVHLKRNRIENATELDIGLTAAQRILVPGKPLKVRMEDRNLAIVGKTTSIRIRAWADSGDEETFVLTPFADSQTRFRGDVATALAPSNKEDGTLQLLGNDTVRFDFTDEFKKAQALGHTATTLRVASDAALFASSGRILSEEEIRNRTLEDQIRTKLAIEGEKQGQTLLSTERFENQIKPGNAINVRVVDLDRSVTDRADKLSVKVSTSSGDFIGAFSLTETDTHSGIFEGGIPTQTSEATAYASDSAEGKKPNFAISAGEHPAWSALPDHSKPKAFSVDLNDNVPLGTLNVVSDAAGRRIKTVAVQTSFNGRDFRTVGRWPGEHKPWDGSLRVAVAKFVGEAPPVTLEAASHYMSEGFIGKNILPKTFSAGSTAFKIEGEIYEALRGWNIAGGEWFVIHMYGLLYNPRRRVVGFRLDGSNAQPRGQAEFMFRVSDLQEDEDGILRGPLNQGVHRMDVFVVASEGSSPVFQVMSDIQNPPNFGPMPADLFDAIKNPEIRKAAYIAPAKIAASEDGRTLSIKFGEETRTRILRLLIEDFETDAPAISKLHLTDTKGEQVLPTKSNLLEQISNQILEIVPGDKISINYLDPKAVVQENQSHEVFLTATYSNAELSAAFVEYSFSGNQRQARYIPMRRFVPGERVNILINDSDGDVSHKLDTLHFSARATGGNEVEFIALESEEHSGVFIGGFIPVEEVTNKKNELSVKQGDQIIITYMDRENTEPGIPWLRDYSIEQASYVEPQLRVYEVVSMPLAPEDAIKPEKEEGSLAEHELFRPRFNLTATWPKAAIMVSDKESDFKPANSVIGGPIFVEILWPTVALSPDSQVKIFAQTSSGRAKGGINPNGAFDVTAPGTIALNARVSAAGANESLPPGYQTLTVEPAPDATTPIDDGRFTFNIPTALGPLPSKTLLTAEIPGEQRDQILSINGSDDIFVGFNFQDDEGNEHWLTRKIVLKGDPLLDVMDRRYKEEVTSAYVGESLYFRIFDLSADRTDRQDEVTLSLGTASGFWNEMPLKEVFEHTGVFKGHLKLVHKKEETSSDPGNVPVVHGDLLTFSYKSSPGAESRTRTIAVHKGANAKLTPFTKRFTDPKIGVDTQLMLSEAFFELAKKHRQMAITSRQAGDDSSFKQLNDRAGNEIAKGRKHLQEAMRDNRDAGLRVQGEYLLANLSLEFANMSELAAEQEQYYQDALSRFTTITATWPENEYAPKAQYKKALVYEKKGEIDTACEEYVKLSYRYPEHELVAETIARLGHYFMAKARTAKKDSQSLIREAELMEKGEAADAIRIRAEKISRMALTTYKTSGQVFSRLAARFPDHRLSAKTNVLSGQAFILAEEFTQAVKILTATFSNPEADKDSAAAAMYWCGHAYVELSEFPEAYRVFKRLTWDYPATKWAKFARGRLTEENIADAEPE